MRQDARRNRVKLLRAARDLFLEQGPDVSLEQVATRADVGVATLYRHFEDRIGLQRAVLLVALRDHIAAARQAREQSLDPGEILGTFLRRLLALRIPAIVPMLLPAFKDLDDDQVDTAAEELDTLVGAIVSEAHEAGVLSKRLNDRQLLGLVARIARPLPGVSESEEDAEALTHLEILLQGLRSSAHWDRRVARLAPV